MPLSKDTSDSKKPKNQTTKKPTIKQRTLDINTKQTKSETPHTRMKAKTNLTEQSYFQNTTTFAKILGQSSSPWSLLRLKLMAIHLGLTDEIKNQENHENSLSALDTPEGSPHW